MKIAAFLDKPICEDEAVKLAEKCAFSSVQNKPSANYTWFRENGVTDTSRYLRKGRYISYYIVHNLLRSNLHRLSLSFGDFKENINDFLKHELQFE